MKRSGVLANTFAALRWFAEQDVGHPATQVLAL